MNYIAEINAFYDWLEYNSIDSSHISLWFALMHIANKTGWQTEFTVPMSTLEFKTGLKKSTIYNARNTLRQLGRIEFRERGGNQCSVYILRPFNGNKRDTNTTQTVDKTDTNTTQTGTLNKLNVNETKQNNIKNNTPLPPDNSGKEKLNQIFKDGTMEFTSALKKSALEWIEYKKQLEKKTAPYVPDGLQKLLKKFKKSADLYGESAVIEVVDESMANNYQGITWDRLKNAKVSGGQTTSKTESDNPFLLKMLAKKQEQEDIVSI